MLTNVQVLAGATSVARFDDVVVWFETGPDGGGVMLTQVLQAVQGVASGGVPSRQLGARLAAVLNTGDAAAVPAMVAATPEGEGLRVVVHGWGAVVADGLHVPNGWVDQVIRDRRTFFLGRNTVTPVAPVDGSSFDLEDGVVPGDGVSFALAGLGGSGAAPTAPVSSAAAAGDPSWPAPAEPPAYEPPPSDPPPVPARAEPARTAVPAPIAWPPPDGAPPGPPPSPVAEASPHPEAQAERAEPAEDAPPATQWWSAGPPAPADPLLPGRLVMEDGSAAVLDHTCVLGSDPYGSPAVQTGVAIPLTVVGVGVAAVHAEIRVEEDRVSVRDLGSGTTHVLAPGTPGWATLAPGQIRPLLPGTRVALGQRTFSYERP